MISRRKFLGTGLTTAGFTAMANVSEAKSSALQKVNPDSFDPWIEVVKDSIAFNVKQLSEQGGNKPVMAVCKNNAYGLGIEFAGPILDKSPAVTGLAVVKTEECFRLRAAGVTKPILLLALAEEREEAELVNQNVELSVFSEGASRRLRKIMLQRNKPVNIHVYVDTGMSRVGLSYRQCVPWILEAAASGQLRIKSTFTDLTEDPDFDKEQVLRLQSVVAAASKAGIDMGKVHACSSHGIYHLPEGCIDWVRPGLSLYGAYPDRADEEQKIRVLNTAFRLRARVVRVEQLQAGDSVSYARKFVASKPTWTATIPVGHSDGYPRTAVNGARILIGTKTYPVIGAVSASHSIVSLGDEKSVNVGDIATLIGPDHTDIHPNHLAKVTDTSVYDLLMHLNSSLPKTLV